MSGRKKTKKENTRVCGDCIHLCACNAWQIGTLDNADATHCINYDTVESWCSWCKLKRTAKTGEANNAPAPEVIRSLVDENDEELPV